MFEEANEYQMDILAETMNFRKNMKLLSSPE